MERQSPWRKACFACIFSFLCGCASNMAPTPPPDTPQRGVACDCASDTETDLVLVRVCGSNSMKGALEDLTKAFLVREGEAVFLEERTRNHVDGLPHEEGAPEIAVWNSDARFEMRLRGSLEGQKRLADRSCDVAASSDWMSDQTRNSFTNRTLSGTVIALDGVVIIVNRDNPIFGNGNIHERSLSRAELRGIFLGDIGDWGFVGFSGEAVPQPLGAIRAFARPSESGTTSTFRRFIGMQSDQDLSVEREISDSYELISTVASDRLSVGYVSLGPALGGDVTFVPILDDRIGQAVRPSPSRLIDNSYPLTRPLLLYTIERDAEGDVDETIRQFLEFAFSSIGHEFLFARGFVPVASGSVVQP